MERAGRQNDRQRLPLRVRSARLAAALLFTLVGACTTLPTQEFAAYRDAFTKARMAGEEVLIDHAAVRAKRAELETTLQLSGKAKPPARAVPFKPEEIMLAGQAVDHVAVRFWAWEVVARYNEALTRLAEGKSGPEVASAFEGVFQSLSDFPLDEIQGLATAIAPFLAPLKIIIAEAEKERARQEFLAVAAIGTPLIKGQFIKLLRDDTGNFHNVRVALNSMEYDPLVDQVDSDARRCERLANAHAETAEMKSSIARINAALLKLPLPSDKVAPVIAVTYKAPSGPAAFTPLAATALEQCKDSVEAGVTRALAKHTELVAYGNMLKAYLVLLSKVSGSLDAVEEAAAKKTPAAPPSRELLGAFITLRQTLLSLRNKE